MNTSTREVTDRDLSEAVARCVGVLVYCHADPESSAARALVSAEAQHLAQWALKAGLDRRRFETSILVPLESELIARFGRTEGRRLLGRFLKPSGRSKSAPTFVGHAL